MVPGCERSRQVVAGPGGCMRSRCVPCTGACAPSPVPRLPSPAPRARVRVRVRVHVFRVLRPAPHARVFRLLHFVPPFPVFCCPRPVARVLRSAFCVLRPAPRAPVPVPPCPCPRPRPRVPRPAPAPAALLPCALCPWPRTRVSCAPCPCPRLLRSADGSPHSAPYLPPPTLRGRSFRLLQAAGMKRKSGGSPQEPPDFACIAAARLTRACG